MRLAEFMALVEGSDSGDWARVEAPLFSHWGGGPAGCSPAQPFVPYYFDEAFVHRDNVDVVLAWRVEQEPGRAGDLRAMPWAAMGGLADDPAPPVAVVLLHRGVGLVEREWVRLGSEAVLLPVPSVNANAGSGSEYYVPTKHLPLARITFALANRGKRWDSLDALLLRCGIEVGGSQPWEA